MILVDVGVRWCCPHIRLRGNVAGSPKIRRLWFERGLTHLVHTFYVLIRPLLSTIHHPLSTIFRREHPLLNARQTSILTLHEVTQSPMERRLWLFARGSPPVRPA